MRSKVTDALDRVDRLLDAARKGAPEPASQSFDDPNEITSRHQVEEIARSAAENAIRAREPSQPHIEIVFPKAPDSDPSTSGGVAIGKHGVKLGKLPPWAVVLIAAMAIGAAALTYIATH